MRPIINKPPPPRVRCATKPRLSQRLGWLLLIWAGSVAALTIVSLLLRSLMSLAGMSP
ncbi:MAG TPA: DUF2474 domain-containing protein [Methylophilus sp.]